MVSIQKIIFGKNCIDKKLQFQTILLRYKKCVTEKKTCVNKRCNLLNPYFPMVLLSKPFNKLPCLIISDDIGFTYVLVLFTSAYLFKQTFAIPGSVFLNLLAGALFGLGLGFPMTCFLTACGATFCYSLAKFAGREAATRYFTIFSYSMFVTSKNPETTNYYF